ncbi:hypothetical protein BG011_000718 [Mortierella polycephala]|uniref:UVR domain-containing protein n=1 Tax=Mortierella polycephala TaxID=41804 RepID=A0A9P6U5S0_9FUNG|nr:hypothetical protein BG011_000718 [Mortierella polycephala]
MASNEHDQMDHDDTRTSFNSLLQSSKDDHNGHDNDDDHDDDGSKEHTSLLSKNSRMVKGKSIGKDKDDDKDEGKVAWGSGSRRQGNRSMVQSLYASPKHSVSQRRQASVPGSPTAEQHPHQGVSPLFLSNMPDLWREDNMDPNNTMRPSSSIIIEDASPPLPWKEPSHRFESEENLSTSQRFSIDAISDGAFAMPSNQLSLTDSQHFPPLAGTISNDTSNTALIDIPAAHSEPKKRIWGPKGAKISEESTLNNASSNEPPSSHTATKTNLDSTMAIQEPPSASSVYYDTPSAGPSTPVSGPVSGRSTPKSNRTSKTKSSTFGLSNLSESGIGIVSGLTSLRNSIMIPALSSSTSTGRISERTNASQASSLAASQSSLLDFVVEEQQPSWQQHQRQSSTSSSIMGSPSLFRSAVLRSGNENVYSNKDVPGSSSMIFERGHKHDRRHKKMESGANNSDNPRGSRVRHSTSGPILERRLSSSTSSLSSSKAQSRRRNMASQPQSAATSLSFMEAEFQELVQQQSQLSVHKVELCKELLSLYSRRNINDQKQETAAKAEQFEEADSAATTIRLVQERIQKLERIYAEADKTLWDNKRRQDELGRSISERQQDVIQEMELMRQTKEKEKESFEKDLQKARENELDRILAERDEVDKERSDVALGQDFLGKNEAELQERMAEETKVEQDELEDLMGKQDANRSEIRELSKKLEDLCMQDQEYDRKIVALEKRIRMIAHQFDDKAKEVAHEKQGLERRISEIQNKAANLDKQEAHIAKKTQEAMARQDLISNEIQLIATQQDRLKDVRKVFEEELQAIQRLRLEEETFREKEAGWMMRTDSLTEDLKESEAQVSKLTTKIAADEKAIVDLEQDIAAGEKRILKTESLKNLAAQRWDFKQASLYSNEVIKSRETVAQQRTELDTLMSKVSGSEETKQLESLQEEYGKLKMFVKEEEAVMFKEIQSVTTETLDRLNNGSSESSSRDTATTATIEEAAERIGAHGGGASSGSKLSGRLLSELRSEIENVREMYRIRFGREETIPTMHEASAASAASTATDSIQGGDGSTTTTLTCATEDIEHLRHTLERDIQAAVAEEDYDTAAELQARLDAL